MEKINKENKLSKKGSVGIILICLVSIFFMIIFSYIYFLFSKINIGIYAKKQDLYLIVQNAVMAFDKEELAYGKVSVDEEILYQKINQIIELNYNDVELKYISYDKNKNTIDIVIYVDLNLDNLKINDKVKIKESIKLKTLEF